MGGLQAITCCTPVKGVYCAGNVQNDVSFGRKINPKEVKTLFEQGAKKAAKNAIKASQKRQKFLEKQDSRRGLSLWQQHALEQSEEMLGTYQALLHKLRAKFRK